MMRTPGFVLARFSAERILQSLRGHRRVQGDQVSARQKIVEFNLFDTKLLGALRAQEWIEGDDPHLQSQGPRGDDRADVPAPDDSERLAGQFDAHEAVLLPLSSLRRDVRARDLPGESEHERDRVLGGGDRIAERRVHHDHAASGRSGNVDVVDPDAGATHDFQLRRGPKQLGRDLRCGANGEPVIVADDLGELLFIEAGFDVDLNATLLEDGDGGGGKLVGDENSGSHEDCSGMAACEGREMRGKGLVSCRAHECWHDSTMRLRTPPSRGDKVGIRRLWRACSSRL